MQTNLEIQGTQITDADPPIVITLVKLHDMTSLLFNYINALLCFSHPDLQPAMVTLRLSAYLDLTETISLTHLLQTFLVWTVKIRLPFSISRACFFPFVLPVVMI